MAAVLSVVVERGALPLADLARLFGTSEATMRRDVAALAAEGLLERTHGGVRAARREPELPYRLRDSRNQAAKARIAAALAGLLPTGRHIVGINGGSTAAAALRALAGRGDLTIVTNSITIAVAAAEQGQERVLITGGVLRPNSLELVGSLAESTLGKVRIETAIVGVDGVSAEGGLTTHDPVEARTNHALIAAGARVVVVADSSKVGLVTQSRMAPIEAVDVLVTDGAAPEPELERIRSAGVKVVVAGAWPPQAASTT